MWYDAFLANNISSARRREVRGNKKSSSDTILSQRLKKNLIDRTGQGQKDGFCGRWGTISLMIGIRGVGYLTDGVLEVVFVQE
jgi:hypothetical protein